LLWHWHSKSQPRSNCLAG